MLIQADCPFGAGWIAAQAAAGQTSRRPAHMKPPPSLAFRAVSSLSTPRFCVPERAFLVSRAGAPPQMRRQYQQILNKCGGYQRLTTPPSTGNKKARETRAFCSSSELLRTVRNGNLVPRRGLEPPLLAEHGPEPCASTNSAIWAGGAHVSGRAGAVNAVFRSGGTIGQGSRGRYSPESGEQDFRSLPCRFPLLPCCLGPLHPVPHSTSLDATVESAFSR